MKHFTTLHGEKGIGMQHVDLQKCASQKPVKSSLNTSFHPHPFSLFLGALKSFVGHGEEENETCTALLWKKFCH